MGFKYEQIIQVPQVFIIIYHEYEGGIEKSVSRITVRHHEAYRMMTKGDPKGQLFLSHYHTNNGFFFLFITLTEYKNLSRISGWDRKIRPEDHRLAS